MTNWPTRPFLHVLCSILLTVAFNPASATPATFTALTPDIEPHYQPEDNLEAGLWLQLDKAEQTLKQSPKRIHDPQLNRYVNDIVCRLAADYCQDIRVYIVRAPYFNAMMTPNGMMIIWSGLLLRVDNEAQLAAVIGHELGHYLRRHSLENFIDRKNKSNLSMFLNLGLAALGAAPISTITDFMLAASFFAHNRGQEYEADKYGLQLMHGAGYDVTEAAKIWDSVIAEDNAGKDDDDAGVPFFATHPSPEDRSAKLTGYADQLATSSTKTEADQQQFVDIVAGFWSTFLNDQVLLNQPKRTEYLLNTLTQKQKLLGTIHYFNGELLRQRNEAGDRQAAENEYQQALQYADAPHEVHRELGLLLLKQKRFQEAHTQLQHYLEQVPEANDREMIEFYLSMEPN